MRRALLAPVLLALTGAGGCGTASPGDGPAATQAAGEWVRIADPPLSPREGAVAATVAGEVVLVGGYGGPPCPPGADCAYPGGSQERDGAAWDPATDAWRPIADAPVPVEAWSPSAVVGTDLFVLTRGALLSWDSTRDAWQRLDPPDPPRWVDLVADGDRLLLASGSDEDAVRPDQVLDTRTGRWSVLPPDPLRPSFDRMVTPTPHGLVLTAKPIGPDGGPANPALVHAALLPRDDAEAPGAAAAAWRQLPPSDQLGGGRWTWTGRRLVDPTLGGADGGEVDGFGRTIPYGGRLEPVTGTWTRLPDPPAAGSGGWPVEATGGPLLAAEGWLHDDGAGTWTPVPRPSGGPAEPGPATWVGDLLVVLGGADWSGTEAGGPVAPADVWSTRAWAWAASEQPATGAPAGALSGSAPPRSPAR